MNVLKSSKEKLSPNKTKKTEPAVSWMERINFMELIKKAGFLFWNNKKRLITIAILLLLTGGQAITMHSSFNGNFGGKSNTSQKKDLNPDQDFQKILSDIESQENFQAKIRELIENKEKLYSDIALISAAIIIIGLIIIVLFLLNCYFHLLFINTVNSLAIGLKKNKENIKKSIKGRWKELAWLRIIFAFIYLGTLLVFLLPTGFFIWQQAWPTAIALGGFSLLAIFVVFIILSYVFRYSLFYLVLGKTSIKESIDCGYELFAKFWKESVLTSLVNFALGIVAGITSIIIILASIIGLGLVAAFFGIIIYLVAGMAHAWGIAIGTGIVFILIPLIIIGILLGAIWQGYVVIFWYYIFSELAGCKLPETLEDPALEKAKKKPAPVIQKDN